MPYLYNKETGQTEQLPAEQVTSAVQTGRYTFLKHKDSTGQIPVRAPDGVAGKIPVEHAQRLFNKGYSYETEEQAKDRVVREEVKDAGIGGQLTTAAVSAFDTYLGGIPLQGALSQADKSGELARYLRISRDENQAAHIIGTIGGALGPGGAGAMMARGGTKLGKALLGKGVASAARQIGARGAGGALEGALAGEQQLRTEEALGNMEYTADSILATVGTGALLGFGLGALGGGASAVRAARAMKKTKQAAMELAAETAEEATIGGQRLRVSTVDVEDAARPGEFLLRKGEVIDVPVPVAKQVAGEAVEEGAKAGLAQRVSRGAAGRALGIRQKTHTKFARRYGDPKKGKEALQDSLDVIMDASHPNGGRIIRGGRNVEDAAERLGETVNYHGQRIGSIVKQADEMAEGLGASRVAARTDDEIRREVGWLSDKAIKQRLKRGPIGDDYTFGAVKSRQQKAFDAAKKAHTEASEAAAEYFVSGKSIANRLRRLASSDDFAAVGSKKGKAELISLADDFEKRGIMSYSDALVERTKLKDAYNKIADPGSVQDAMRKAERAVASEVDSKAGALLRERAPELLDQWDESRTIFSAAKEISDTSTEQAIRNEFSNNYFSLTSKIGGAAMAAGRAGDAGVIESAVSGSLTGLAIQFAKERGASTLYAIADKASRLGAMKRAADKTDGIIRKSIKSVFGRAPSAVEKFGRGTRVVARLGARGGKGAAKEAARSSAIQAASEAQRGKRAVPYIPAAVRLLQTSGVLRAPSKPDENMQAAAKRWGEELAKLSTDPERIADIISSQSAGLEFASPKVASHVSTKMARRVQFLQSKVPKQPETGSALQPINPNWKPTRDQAAKFGRYLAAAMKPLSVFEDLENGLITKEGVETLQTLYPELYEKAKQEVIMQAAERPESIPYNAKVRLSVLFGVPLDKTLAPEFIHASQAAYSGEPTDGHGGGGMRLTGLDQQLDLGKSAATAAQSMEAEVHG